jgi:protein arginine kinase activator
MLCQNCQKNVAKVHVTELRPGPDGASGAPDASAGSKSSTVDSGAAYHEQHLCEVCAESMDLPNMPQAKKSTQEIWKLLQMAAQQTRKKSGPACPDCGMTLDEFRKKGRLGCARDYEVFKTHIVEILERVHGARRHVGRLPRGAEASVPEPRSAATPGEEKSRLVELRRELESAIRDEAYERAAHLRDAIKALEETHPG